MKAISLGYHDVCEGEGAPCPILSGHTTRYTLHRRDFRLHLASIRQKAGARSVQTLDRFLTWEDDIPVFLTFDDGAISGYTCVADELEELNWRGHFFVTTDWIGRPGFLSGRHIRELCQRGHVIGSHSCSHPARMSHLPQNALLREWSRSIAVLSDILGLQVALASLPDGYYSDRVGNAAAVAGIRVLFTSEPKLSASRLNNCLVLGRYFIQHKTPPGVSGAIASGARHPRLRQALLWKTKCLAKALAGPSYDSIRRFILLRGLPRLAEHGVIREDVDR